MKPLINTLDIKLAQLEKGSWSTGSGNETILIIGSCRCINYVNYLKQWNESNGNRFTIHHLDPFNWNFKIVNGIEERTDFEATITALETDSRILNLLSKVDIYIHEYYNQFGMFNTDNIKNFGLNPKQDICLPNFNDLFILYNDLMTFDKETQEQPNNLELVKEKGLKAIDKFYWVCQHSSMPEMEDYFRYNWQTTRFFWTYNHISTHFTLKIWELLNEKFLHLENWNQFENMVDMFSSPCTQVHINDRKIYGIKW